jgi:hypothetical protein
MSGTNVLASSLVYSHTLRDLYLRISDSGWSIRKIKYDKKEDCYVASAKDPFGKEVEKTGNSEEMATRNLVLAIERLNHMRSAAQIKIGQWKTDWSDQLQPIAEAYAKAPVYDPKAATAFKELGDDSTRRANVLRKQIEVEETNNPEPYPSHDKMLDDIHKRQHYEVSRANTDHPIWTPEQVVAHRMVHDILGHGVAGGKDFGWDSENRATAAHMPLLSENAQKALFTEHIARPAYETHYRNLSPQKIALFPQFVEPIQKAEGIHPNFQGIHPSQSVAPTAMPAIKPPKPVAPNPVPGMDFGRIGSVLPGQDVDPTLADPNANYQTGIQAMEPNAYLHHGDPLQAQDTLHNASLIDTEWSKLKTGENKPDFERMKLAIVNAFRAVLLSPRTNLKDNTQHYQDISGVPPGVTDPTVYRDTLENKRQAQNVKNFGENARFSHQPYFKLLPQFERLIYDRNPQAGWEAAKSRAQHELFDWEQEEQEHVMEADEKRPEGKRATHAQIERAANKALTKKIETFLAEHKGYDQPNLFTAAKKEPTKNDSFFPLEPQIEQQKLPRYPAVMNSHLKAIAQVSTHADTLLKAALEDVHEHDGSGHHFRAAATQLGVTGVGPKVASFAWLLLQPTTSQLATIDAHTMAMLGKNDQTESNTRDSFARERELQAGRDAAGYGHVPLGAFQWSMLDHQHGDGVHEDRTGLRVLDPTPHDSIDWPEKEQVLQSSAWGKQAPDWWQQTEPYRKQVGEQWDEKVNTPKTQVPFQAVASLFKTATILRTPWFTHPQTGEHITGQPGDTLMQHAVNSLHLSTPEIWSQVQEAGKS